ncbi:MAG: hypothetical protein AB7E81_15695 [Hyphomicrobiaceae bacterium]
MRLVGGKISFFRSVWLAGLVAIPVVAGAAQSAAADEVIVTVEHVLALDKIDLPTAGQADFYAQVTIDGRTVKSKFIRRADEIRPNWVMPVRVRPGKHRVKLEILDHNVMMKPTLVDINRLPGKRDLDFEVDTRRCVVTGFAEEYKCSARIRRAGAERRRAEITFTVDVERR